MNFFDRKNRLNLPGIKYFIFICKVHMDKIYVY